MKREMSSAEEALIERCLQQDSAAQKTLYETYANRMYAICMRYADNPDTAKDLLQEGFIRVFKAMPGFRKEGSFEGWMKRIFVNNCIEYYRSKRSQPWFSDVDEAAGIQADDHTLSNFGVEELLGLIRQLPDGYRTVFNMYAIEGYAHKEIADQLGISESTSKTQLLKARLMLQRLIAEKGGSRFD
jgi:RNA polymerase sigma-70 factor (ECF subfamily)